MKDLRETFEARFGAPPTLVVRAPGRVNLLGEHTDYNDGFALPVAIDREIRVAASPREDHAVSLYAMQYAASSLFSLDLIRHSRAEWSNYVRGIVGLFLQQGKRLTGFNAVFDGDIPQGAGLSSSAALEVAFALMLRELNELPLSDLALAQLGRQAENDFMGIQCGILDQFASLFGKKDSAILLDCRTLEHKPIPLLLDRYDLALVLANSGVRRALLSSEYNARRLECEQGVRILGQILRKPLRSLRDVSVAEFTTLAESLPETLCKRSWHVISENERVREGADALERGDFEEFGALLNHSHESLRDDFEVSCPEVDLLVELAQETKGVLGARMTGAGFGGCTINLVKKSAMDRFRARVIEPYQRRTGHRAEILVFSAVAGASRL